MGPLLHVNACRPSWRLADIKFTMVGLQNHEQRFGPEQQSFHLAGAFCICGLCHRALFGESRPGLARVELRDLWREDAASWRSDRGLGGLLGMLCRLREFTAQHTIEQGHVCHVAAHADGGTCSFVHV